MDVQPTCRLDVLEQRLVFMRELATELERAQAAVLASDLKKLQLHTARQLALCEAVYALKACVLPADVSADSQQSWAIPMQKLAETENRVQQLNRIHAALLRRSSRTLAIFSRALASSALTYVPSQAQSSAVELCTGK